MLLYSRWVSYPVCPAAVLRSHDIVSFWSSTGAEYHLPWHSLRSEGRGADGETWWWNRQQIAQCLWPNSWAFPCSNCSGAVYHLPHPISVSHASSYSHRQFSFRWLRCCCCLGSGNRGVGRTVAYTDFSVTSFCTYQDSQEFSHLWGRI